MSKLEKSVPDFEQEEDAATLAAIDEGVRDAEVGRTVTAEKVREILQSLLANNRRK